MSTHYSEMLEKQNTNTQHMVTANQLQK